MMTLSRSILILSLCSLFVVTPLQAKIRKCVLSNGHVIFTDVGCPEKTIPNGQKIVAKEHDPFAGMNKKQRQLAIVKRNKGWQDNSRSMCLHDIDAYAKTLLPNFSEIVVKKQHKLVTKKLNKGIVEFVHRISFHFMAGGTEWQSSGNCRATLVKNKWVTDYRRITTGIPFISARKKKSTQSSDTHSEKQNNAKVTASNKLK